MISWEIMTDKGKRSHNEDMVGCREKDGVYCFVLADGLGGHQKGEVASRLVVDTILQEFENGFERDTFLEKAFAKAQSELLQRQKQMNCMSEMKTTVVCLIIDEVSVQWGFCGDSRLYYCYKRKIKSRTIDHSVPQLLVLSKQIREKEIRFHEDRNRLLRVMGMEYDKAVYEIMQPIQRKGKQQFLLCSDGFWEYISERDMEKTLKKSGSPKEWMEKMLQLVMKNGMGQNMDNLSAIAVWEEDLG